MLITIFQAVVYNTPFLFPRLNIYVYIKSANPKKPEDPAQQAPNPKNPSKDLIPKTPTTKMRLKCDKLKILIPGKNI